MDIEQQHASLHAAEDHNMEVEPQPESFHAAENDDMDIERQRESFHTTEDDEIERQRVCLYTAAIKGDWETASRLDTVLRSKINDYEETALHVAAIAEKIEFVEKLVDHINGDSAFLETVNIVGNTALCYAATTGVVDIARIMLEANEPNQQGYFRLANQGKVKPLSMAALLGHCKMVRYLLPKTDLRGWTEGTDLTDLFTNCIRFGLCDEALEMLKDATWLATKRNERGETGLEVLARQPSVFLPETQPGWRALLTGFGTRNNNNVRPKAVKLVTDLYDRILKSRDLSENKREIVKPLLVAAEKGNEALVIELIRCDPNLLWRFDTNLGTIFHIAVRYRQEKIYSLLYDNLGSFKDLVAEREVPGRRNMLHLAAELAPPTQLKVVAGAALQMRRELLWFKEVEKIVKPSCKATLNSENKTPQMVFDETHKDLMSAGEMWMKKTSESSMVVAALIATIMFAAAFTVPGGFNNSNGAPIFKKRKWFLIFALADAFALFCSSTSILMFHSIITSRYTEDDFLESLPFRLMVGVMSLFASVAAMMVAFCATFLLYYPSENVPWIFALFALFACVPTLYVSLKYPLLVDLIRSRRDAKFMFQPRKQLFL